MPISVASYTPVQAPVPAPVVKNPVAVPAPAPAPAPVRVPVVVPAPAPAPVAFKPTPTRTEPGFVLQSSNSAPIIYAALPIDPDVDRKIKASTSSMDDRRVPPINPGAANINRSGSVRNAMMSLFFSPLAKKDFDGNVATLNSNADSEPVPSLDGEDDFSDGEEETLAATGGSVRGMSKSVTLSNLSEFDKGKEKERDKERDTGMRKSLSSHALEQKGRGRSHSLSEERTLDTSSAFAFSPDPGSEIEIAAPEVGRLEVTAGSITDLANFLAPVGRIDSDYITDFFFSYRYFINSADLATLLADRFEKYLDNPTEGEITANLFYFIYLFYLFIFFFWLK